MNIWFDCSQNKTQLDHMGIENETIVTDNALISISLRIDNVFLKFLWQLVVWGIFDPFRMMSKGKMNML